MSNLGNVLRKLVYSNVSQTGVWGRSPQPPVFMGVWGQSPQPLGDFCKIWKKNVCFGKMFVKCLLKNVSKNGIKIAFFLPLGQPLASSMILR